MVANNFQHSAVGKALFVITESCGSVDAGENRRLPGSALRPACNSQAGVGRNNDALEDRGRCFSAEDCKGLDVVEFIERVVWTT